MFKFENLFTLTNQVALVTGGASGLGKYYTEALFAAKADVCVVSRSQQGWDEIQSLAIKYQRRVVFIQQDITIPGSADKIVAECMAQLGRLDILVNNAGIQIRNDLLAFEDEDWQQVIDTNLNALYYLSHAAATVMVRQKKGKIINIGSMQSFRAGKYIFPYTASKHGVIGLTKAYADALAPQGIQVNAIAPGYIDTAMTKALQDDATRNTEILAHIPAGYWANPKELMGTLIYLASNASNYVTGATIPVDGGYLLR